MDSGLILVLVLMLGALAFLIYAERNSRQNEARLKAESGAKAEPDQSSEGSLEAKSRQESKKAQSS